MSFRALLVDAGHGLNPSGGIDNGAIGNSTERDQVVALAKALIPLLQQLPLEVVPIGVDNRLSLPDKINLINDTCKTKGWNSGDALLLSLHMNAGAPSAHGVEAWYSSQKPAEMGLAQTLAQSVAKFSGMALRSPAAKPSASDRLGRLGILDETVPTAVLVECGFVTNAEDLAVVEQRTPVVRGLYLGLLDYLHLSPPPMDHYQDIAADAWYTPAVYQCVQAGIFQIPENGLFRPGDPLTRAEAAEMFARLLARPS